MHHKRIAFAVAAAVTALSLAGCGSSDSDSAAPAATSPAAVAEPTTAAPTDAAGTIVEVASSNPDFSTLVTAVKAADLAETLGGEGPFTVFAPTNGAFEKLPDGLLDKLLKPANKKTLAKILTYHVVSGKAMAADVKPGKVATVEGSKITIKADGGVTVDKATVTATDVAASNGVIHVIDSVLVPADVDVSTL